MKLEKGRVLLEALLMIGLFLLFISMMNRSLTGISISLEKIDKASDQRVEWVNQKEECRSRSC